LGFISGLSSNSGFAFSIRNTSKEKIKTFSFYLLLCF